MEDDLILEVIGAGDLRISKSAKWRCGGKDGFSLDVSWIGIGYTGGGVLSREDAVKLANHILENIDSD